MMCLHALYKIPIHDVYLTTLQLTLVTRYLLCTYY